MKTTFLFLALAIGMGIKAQAGNDAYTQAMETNIQLMKDAESLEQFQAVANTFSRISEMNKNEWLPAYYSGFIYTIMSFQKGLSDDERDAYLDQAEEFADEAAERSPDNSEVVALQGYAKMAKLSVKPAIRGPFMTATVMKLFGEAMELNPDNPRAMLLMGRMKYGTAQFFKSGTDEACAMVQGSLQLFEKEAQTNRGIQPHWGKGMAEQVSKACQSTEE